MTSCPGRSGGGGQILSPAGRRSHRREAECERILAPFLRFRALKIAYSWKCNARCAHCSVSAGPAEEEKIDRHVVLDCIDDAAALGLGVMEFTGGEIFLFYRDLVTFLDRASRRGMISVVDSNGFWAKSPAIAVRRLDRLKRLGLRRLILSTDRYHREFVSLSRVLCALEAARELQIETSVTLCAQTGDPEVLATLATLRRQGASIDLQPVGPVGRATALPTNEMSRCSYEAAGAPCSAVFAPTVAPDARVTLCCAPPTRFPRQVAQGSPLVLGWVDQRRLRTILLDAQRDPLLNELARRGAGGLVDRLRSRDSGFYTPREGGYFGKCDLCMELLASQPRVDQLRRMWPTGLDRERPGGGM